MMNAETSSARAIRDPRKTISPSFSGCSRLAIACFLLAAALLLPAAAVAQDMSLSDVLLDGAGWQLVSEGHKFTEGPAPDSRGNVFFVDVPESRIFRIDAETGKVSVFVDGSGKASGLMFGPEGRLYACQSETKQIVWYDTAGKEHVLAKDIPVNDLVVDRQGGVYVTDMGGKQVWHVSPNGEKRVVASGFTPNGLILWRDGGTLVVADWDEPDLRTFRVETDGGLKYGEKYYGPLQMPFGQEKPGSDGLTCDDDGRVYVCTHAGLQMFDPTGRLCGAIVKPQNKFLSNVAFGGKHFDMLYVTCSDKVYSRKTRVRGTPNILPTPKPDSGK
jgi:gluconolactonase